MFCVTDVLLKCRCYTDIVMSWCSVLQMCWCSMLQMCYWSAIASCQVTLTLLCPDLCYRCLMFCVTDVLLKCHGSLPGHTDIVMSCAFSPSGDILASGYVCFCLYEILVMSFFFSAFKTYCKISLIKYICIALSSMWIFSIGRNSIFFLFFFKSHIIMTVHVSLPESQCRKICCKC